MAGPIDGVYVDGVPVQKGNVRADDKTGHRRTMASVNDVRNADLTGQFGGIYVSELKQFYDIDTENLDADDGDEVIIDVQGNHFVKLDLGSGSGGGSVLRGYISGLTLSNDPVTPATILNIAPGVATSDDNSESMLLALAMSKTTALWAVGSGNGGLDAGSVAANTWYHAFLIKRTDTGVVDVLLSTSATAPTLPTNYTKKRRIGAILTDASADIIPFTQVGNEFLWKTVPPYVSAGSPPPAAVATAMALMVPTGVQVRARVSVYLNSNELVRRSVFLTSPDQVQSTALVGSKSSLIAGSNLSPGYPGPTQGTFFIRTNTSGQIYYELDGSSAATGLRFITEGWDEYL